MNEATHTPGPWSLGIIKDNPASVRSMAVWPDNIQVGQIAEPVCLIAPMANYNDTDEANARLIAAAPDLLEALERIANHFDADGYGGGAWKSLALEMAEVARAAIKRAKATGQ